MKKLYSLIRASMTTGMNLFKINTKSKLSRTLIPLFVALYLMLVIGISADVQFKKLAEFQLQSVLLSLFTFGISMMTLMEGIYKTGPLIFNCKDDQLLLSLPIKRRTVLFVRVFKFYVFELIFNSLFMLPIVIAYIRWVPNLSFSYFLTSFIVLLLLPIIPIVISCILGVITSSISSRFKHKNIMQIVVSMMYIVFILYVTYNMDNIFNFITKYSTSINDVITKIYYPAGIYAKLVTNFNMMDLLIFIVINISIFIISMFVLSKFYFKINSRLKKVITTSKVKTKNLVIKSRTKVNSLIRKELNTFIETPVLVINSAFALVLFIVASIIVYIKFDSIITMITSNKELNLSIDLIMNNKSILIFMLLAISSYMTSITNSLISLEGRNINILKSLPVKPKTILMSKIYSCLLITTPVMLIGDIILFVKLKISVFEMVLIILLSILVPLVSHFIGLIVNLKYPKLDAENSAEIVKQSASSFISVMIGMLLLIITIVIIIKVVGSISSISILLISVIIYILINTMLYLYLINKSVKEFNNLSV